MSKVVKWVKSLGAFGAGMLIGTCYGAVVASFVSFGILRAL